MVEAGVQQRMLEGTGFIVAKGLSSHLLIVGHNSCSKTVMPAVGSSASSGQRA